MSNQHESQSVAASKLQSQPKTNLDCVMIRSGALRDIAPYVEEKNYRQILCVTDPLTYEAAGKSLLAAFKQQGRAVHLSMMQANSNGDVLPDETALLQLILDIQQFAGQVVIAVGGGTIHDIVRYAAYTMGIPFISVPTAPSVDGFNSRGAPILFRGEKKTVLATAPDAVFADLDVLIQAPPSLVAAGFGDMLGKYTSLFDWWFGALVADEPYLKEAEEMTRNALERCMKQVELIALRQEEGIHTLMSALIESGMAMLQFGQSHPASGAEHHLSHYWEMEYVRLGKKQLLHGAKVGVACTEISRLYHQIGTEGMDIETTDAKRNIELSMRLRSHWSTIQQEIQRIPDPLILTDLLRMAGGPTTLEELAIHPDLFQRSLQEAHRVRPNRFTLLAVHNLRYEHRQ